MRGAAEILIGTEPRAPDAFSRSAIASHAARGCSDSPTGRPRTGVDERTSGRNTIAASVEDRRTPWASRKRVPCLTRCDSDAPVPISGGCRANASKISVELAAP